MKQGFSILALILLLSAFIYAEDKVVSFSEEIFYTGNRKDIKDEIAKLNSRHINFKAQTSFSLDIPEFDKIETADKIEAILTDVKNFSDIPYYSKRHDSTYPLFKKITVLEDYKENEGRRIILANQTIPPFKPADIRYTIEKHGDYILFKAENIENIRWWILPVITKQKLLILFAAEIKNGQAGMLRTRYCRYRELFLYEKAAEGCF